MLAFIGNMADEEYGPAVDTEEWEPDPGLSVGLVAIYFAFRDLFR